MKTTRMLFPIIAFLCALAAGEIVFLLVKGEFDRQRDQALSTISSTFSQSIQRQIAVATSSTNMLKVMLKLTNFSTERFDDWAAEALAIYPTVSVLQLAPKGVIEKVHPIQGYEHTIGHDLLSDHHRQDAAKLAIRQNQLTLTGPIRLRQNGELGIVARLPITRNIAGKEVFWGFSIAVIHLDNLMAEALADIENKNLRYSLYGTNPDAKFPPLVARTKVLPSPPMQQVEVLVPNGSWQLTVGAANSPSYLYHIIHLLIIMTALIPGTIAYRSVSQAWRTETALEKLNQELDELANTDALTALPNRRSGNHYAEQQLAVSRRSGTDFSIAFLDLDFFKKINDLHGHDVGDQALQHFAGLFSVLRRETDMLSRWGGEEFILVLPATDQAGAMLICEIMRKQLHDSSFKHQSSPITLSMTMSIGVSTWQTTDSSLDSLIQRADQGVYKAKQEGRNCVVYT